MDLTPPPLPGPDDLSIDTWRATVALAANAWPVRYVSAEALRYLEGQADELLALAGRMSTPVTIEALWWWSQCTAAMTVAHADPDQDVTESVGYLMFVCLAHRLVNGTADPPEATLDVPDTLEGEG